MLRAVAQTVFCIASLCGYALTAFTYAYVHKEMGAEFFFLNYANSDLNS